MHQLGSQRALEEGGPAHLDSILQILFDKLLQLLLDGTLVYQPLPLWTHCRSGRDSKTE